MGIYTTLPEEIEEVDVVVAGGGTAGCVVASRLADADPKLTILIIESGKNNYHVPTVNHPLLWKDNHIPDNKRVFFHVAVKEEQLADRESIVQVGNTLGGGSSVNLMMYTRAQRCDYDSWNTEGWAAGDLLSYLKKFETYHGLIGKEHHGYDGPVQVSHGTFYSARAERDFVHAMEEVGFCEVEDLQDLDSIGVARGRKFISPDGMRQDVAHTYLHPRLQDGKHPNLHVLVESQVIKVILDDGRVSAVEYRPNPTMQSNIAQTVRTVKVKKLAVLSCGTLGTPSVLERSGIGNPDVLKKAGISGPSAVDLPGVGHDYQDHHITIYGYKSDLTPDLTTDGIHSDLVDVPALLARRDNMLGWNGIDASSKVRPTSSEVDDLGPAFRDAWDKDFKDPGKPLIGGIFATDLLGDRSLAPPGQYFSMAAYTSYPYSRGYIAYKKQREVARRMAIHQGELPYRHPVFPPESKASYTIDVPGKGASSSFSKKKEDIEYSAEDDAIIEKFIRENLTTCWHGIGTCKMAPREQLGVVDKNLGVYGVSGLKIADLSIAPENVSANTMSTALAIGEKAADIFIRELGLD
ncbi:putative alcohol oxidase [Annulohypoxylon moriforme]|nr:putative alcohol oxidase [Annulohypoxylon moriforme]